MYSVRNWVDVILSRMQHLDGLFLLKTLDKNQDSSADQNLLKEEVRLKN